MSTIGIIYLSRPSSTVAFDVVHESSSPILNNSRDPISMGATEHKHTWTGFPTGGYPPLSRGTSALGLLSFIFGMIGIAGSFMLSSGLVVRRFESI